MIFSDFILTTSLFCASRRSSQPSFYFFNFVVVGRRFFHFVMCWSESEKVTPKCSPRLPYRMHNYLVFFCIFLFSEAFNYISRVVFAAAFFSLLSHRHSLSPEIKKTASPSDTTTTAVFLRMSGDKQPTASFSFFLCRIIYSSYRSARIWAFLQCRSSKKIT